MDIKRAITSLASGIFLLCMVSQAQAIPITVNGILSPGGVVSGSIDFTIGAVPGPVTAWNLLVSGGVDPFGGTIADQTYNNGNSTAISNNPGTTAFDTGAGRVLSLIYTPTLDQPAPYQLFLSENYNVTVNLGQGPIDVTLNRGGGGSASAVPEPGTILLFGSGLLGLGLWRYRKNLNS